MKKIFFPITIITLICLVLAACNRSDSKSDKSSSDLNSKTYTLFCVKKQSLSSTLRLPAQLNAFENVNIYPKVNGYVKEVLVDMGSKVKQGQILMQLEAPELMQNSVAAHERYIRAQASYGESRDNYFRLLKTSETAGAVSPNDLQSAQAKMQSDSAWSNSEKANWMAMQSMNDYLTVRAPFDGTITQRNVHPGALVAIGNKTDSKPMLELQQTTKLRLQVNVPETYATQLQANQNLIFTVEAIPGKKFSGTISRQASSLDEKFRNEMIEIDVLNSGGELMPGMYAEVLLPLNGHDNALLAPQSAVVISTEKKYVIKVQDNKASIIDVRTGNEDNGMAEIFGDIVAGDSVIVNAEDDIKPGQTVR